MHRLGSVAGWFALVVFGLALLAAGYAWVWYPNPILRLGWIALVCTGWAAFMIWAVCLIVSAGQRSIAWWRARGLQ